LGHEQVPLLFEIAKGTQEVQLELLEQNPHPVLQGTQLFLES
jgi:hypothetical protein